MPASYHHRLVGFAASLTLLMAGCTATKTTQQDATMAQLPQAAPQEAYVGTEGTMDTESTIWTVLGIAKKPKAPVGPVTGAGVSPVLWQAALDTLHFAEIDSSDPMAGLMVTKWYSPHGKPDERLRITAFIKSRALRSDSLTVTVERQTRAAGGQWQDGTVAAEVGDKLENDILEEARQIHIAQIHQEQQ